MRRFLETSTVNAFFGLGLFGQFFACASLIHSLLWDDPLVWIIAIYLVATLMIMLSCRPDIRDNGYSGTWLFLGLVPVAGGVTLVCLPSRENDSRGFGVVMTSEEPSRSESQ